MKSQTNPTIRLWNDNSQSAELLVRALQGYGYSVRSILSGSHHPLAEWGGNIFSGYAEIHRAFRW